MHVASCLNRGKKKKPKTYLFEFFTQHNESGIRENRCKKKKVLCEEYINNNDSNKKKKNLARQSNLCGLSEVGGNTCEHLHNA